MVQAFYAGTTGLAGSVECCGLLGFVRLPEIFLLGASGAVGRSPRVGAGGGRRPSLHHGHFLDYTNGRDHEHWLQHDRGSDIQRDIDVDHCHDVLA